MPADRRSAGPARILDVAKLAGVSAQTVSNVMNGRTGFSPQTRDRVLAAVEETGYSPDPAARHLRTRRARKIGFSMTADNLDPRNPFALVFLRSILTSAVELDHRVVVLMHESESDRSFAGDLAAREVDGFVLANSSPGDYRVRLLLEHRVPFALMGRTAPDQPQPWVDIDNRAGMRQAVGHLLDTGRRRFGYVGYDTGDYWDVDRLAAVRERVAQAGADLEERHVLLGSIDRLEAPVRRMLRSADRPDAIVTSSDSLGIVVVNAAHAEGVVPGVDVAITGFDGAVLERTVMPHLTTVRIPAPRIARAVMQRLMDEMAGDAADAPGQVMPTRLVVGGTT